MGPSTLTLQTIAPEVRPWLAPAGTAAAAATGAIVLGLPPAAGAGIAAVSVSAAMVAWATGHHAWARHLGGAAAGFTVGAIAQAIRASRVEDGWPVTRGAALVLWGTLERRLASLGDILARTQPQIIIVHGNDGLNESYAARLRSLVPSARYWTEQWVQGPSDVSSALDRARRAADILGAEAAVWNAERPWKDTGREGSAAAQSLLGSWKRATGLPQGFTSYARPTLHRAFPWAGFAGGRDAYGSYDLRCEFSLPQVYPFGDEMRSGVAPYPALTESMRQYLSSWAAAVADGMISPSVASAPMIPAAHLSEADFMEALGLSRGSPIARPPCAVFWPHHGAVSAEGESALRAFSEAFR